MIGPDQFREFALPQLKKEMRRLDAVEYHLDGPEAVKHLDALCEIENLAAIEWVPGAGNGELQDWTWLFDRIDKAHKGQIRRGTLTCDEAGRIWRRYGSRRIFFNLSAASRAEVEDCLSGLESMTGTDKNVTVT